MAHVLGVPDALVAERGGVAPGQKGRLRIVQAVDEGLPILTSDHAFEPYRVPVVWA